MYIVYCVLYAPLHIKIRWPELVDVLTQEARKMEKIEQKSDFHSKSPSLLQRLVIKVFQFSHAER